MRKFPFAKFQYQFASCQGQGCRIFQEDVIGKTEICKGGLNSAEEFFMMISDGMGGLENGEKCAQITRNIFLENIRQIDHKDIPGSLVNTANLANEAVTTENQKRNVRGGCTLAGIYVWQDRLYWISVGDSLIFIFRNHVLYQMNEEHLVKFRLYDEFLASPQKVLLNSQTDKRILHRLTSYIGKEPLTRIDYNRTPFPIHFHDKILICSDGVTNTISHQDLVTALAQKNAEASSRKIDEYILKRNNPVQDNYSACIIFCG